MNKIDIRSSSGTILELESLGFVTLGEFWNGLTLAGDYWRFYHHDAPGAAVLVRGKRIEMRANRAYLLAPDSNLEARCNGSPVQLFIHAELPGVRCNLPDAVFELPEHFAEAEIADLRRRIPVGNAESRTIKLKAMALASAALAQLPEAVFHAPAMDSRIAAVRGFINTHIAEEISLEALARHVHLHPEPLVRLFREECGTTPHQYVLQQRYTLAARLLSHSDLSIEEICDAIGVHDRFHFSRLFKRRFGIAPGAYRKCYTPGGENNPSDGTAKSPDGKIFDGSRKRPDE